MHKTIKLYLAMAFLSSTLITHGSVSTISLPIRSMDRTEIDSFGRDFFTASCAFSDTSNLKGQKDVFYTNITQLHPSQTTYSLLNTEEKVVDAINKNYATRNANGSYDLSYDKGRAIYPKKKAFPVLNTPWGLMLLDGHHRAMASVVLGATTLPVKIYADLTDAGIDELRVKMNSIDSVDEKGNRVRMPCNLNQMSDDPNRYFVKISAYQGNGETEKEVRSKYPLWIPVGEEDTHGPQEFDIAILLNKYGWVYKNTYGDQIPENFLEYARVLLTAYSKEIPHICVIKQKTLYSEVNDQLCSAK